MKKASVAMDRSPFNKALEMKATGSAQDEVTKTVEQA